MSVIRNPNLGPSQMRMRRRRLFLIRSCIVLFFLLIIVLGLAIYSGHEKVKIQTILVSGNAAVSSDAILATANQVMSGRYYYLFAKNNYLIFPRWEIQERLLEEFKTIKEVDISWENWQIISIKITERRPHSIWCGADIKAVEQKCYFVDKEGYIYGLAGIFSGSMFVKNYCPILSNQLQNISQINPLGSYFLSKNIYIQIYDLIQILDQRGLKVTTVSFDGADFKFKLDTGPEIIFNNKRAFELSFQNLFSAIETENLNLEKDASLINYIDLRFDNKIVVGKKEI